ncbi:hypothetical protein CDAR_373841 [Caerostris darwini]|uniref:Uncharacterized protein n=1 Tax=Caerostris darwini TaxID=1538125 RepID=A0AAV4QHS2_9ARAC|nr:hypothetical protein CDAR_373841 [Caerostris darwini]
MYFHCVRIVFGKRCPQELRMIHDALARDVDFSDERGQDRWIGHAGKMYSSSKNGCALQFIKFTLTDDDMYCFCRCLKIIRRKAVLTMRA